MEVLDKEGKYLSNEDAAWGKKLLFDKYIENEIFSVEKGVPIGKWSSWYENGNIASIVDYRIKGNRLREKILFIDAKSPLYPMLR